MSEPLEIHRPKELAVELRRMVQQRATAEVELTSDLAAKRQASERQHEEAQREASARHVRDREETQEEYARLRNGIINRFQTDQASAEQDYTRSCREIVSQADQAEAAEKHRRQDAQWQATAIFEAAKNALDARLKDTQAQLAGLGLELAGIAQQAAQVLLRWPQTPPPRRSAGAAFYQGNPIQRLVELIASARRQLMVVWNHANPGLFRSAVNLFRRQAARRTALADASLLREMLAEGELAQREAGELLQAEYQRQVAAITMQLNAETKKAEDDFAQAGEEIKRRKQESLRQSEERFTAQRTTSSGRHNSERRELEERFERKLKELDARYQREAAGLQRGFTQAMADRETRHRQQWGEMSAQWLEGIARYAGLLDEMNGRCRQRFPDWSQAAWDTWQPPAGIPRVIPFGRLELKLDELEGGRPQDPQLSPSTSEFSIPLVFPFREHALLLWKAAGEGRLAAIESIQNVMLRMLTSLPPGKVRFLIVDPVGLGENFSAFMHLADYNEQLLSNRIWTDSAHIDRRLAELTEHMENVIQVYLRNEYPTLQDYNESAGELAEPYRVLVVANFPANFGEQAARRLLSIAASGARCGVYTLLSLDRSLQLPREFSLADLERQALRLNWTGDRFVCDDPDLKDCRLELEAPPEPERFTRIVRAVGAESRDAGRIELPFEWIVPPRAEWWTADSRRGIDSPLGRAGVSKFQHLQLGKGTAQHVLVAGKTGSGKSTLLHVLILNLAMRYSPDEIELYLIDFKKGVEFKAYAEAELPHARVIAIESEREFGLSVLERLDQELKERGDLFRQRGVQDLQGFREADPTRRMPRVMLIVDEFQELFVEDDRISQTASLLLDRLVRQGRAFGIHIFLGSQTLAGAYSIPRATIGQMAVRIALQCSEADAHLILSEENTAARLLGRPGEAIYNDANGLYEGNHPFQIMWLSEKEREQYLGWVREYAAARGHWAPAIVFEGNQPADPAKNRRLCELLAAPTWGAPAPTAKAWIGSPVAIRDSIAATFIRQGGSHLVVVGHQEETAVGILSGAMISLAAQHAPGEPENGQAGTRFFVLDGMRPDAPLAGIWQKVADALPHTVRLGSPRATAEVIGELAAELGQRMEGGREDAPPIYLIVYDLARFRDLRKSENDFGFSRSEDEPPDPSRQFRDLLHEGPAHGIHVLAWADSYNGLSRALDRSTLEDVEMRVLFRMNPGDSSSLMDSPAAAQLGVFRAIFDDEGQGISEKFRPYGPPSDSWLATVSRQLRARSVPAR